MGHWTKYKGQKSLASFNYFITFFFLFLHTRGNPIKDHAFAGFSQFQQNAQSCPFEGIHVFFFLKAILFNNWLSTGVICKLWVSESVITSGAPTIPLLYTSFSVLHTHFPPWHPFSLSCHIVFLLTFPSLVRSLSPAELSLLCGGCWPPFKGLGEDGWVLCGCVCVYVCECAISLRIIRYCGSGLRSVQVYRDFPSQSSTWNLVDWLVVCSSSAFHSHRKRAKQRREKWQEFAWCL